MHKSIASGRRLDFPDSRVFCLAHSAVRDSVRSSKDFLSDSRLRILKEYFNISKLSETGSLGLMW